MTCQRIEARAATPSRILLGRGDTLQSAFGVGWILDRGQRARASFVARPGPTVKVALALVNPMADAITVAVPAVVVVKLDVATPLVGVTGEAGLKVPGNPLTEKVMGLVAVLTVLPYASWMVAV